MILLSQSALAGAITASACVFMLPVPASPAVLQSFDRVFMGEDPSEVFTFDLTFDPSVPSELRFDGFVENLDTFSETGVRFTIQWPAANGTAVEGIVFPEGEDYFMGVRLPPADPVLGVIRVPVQFAAQPDFSPSSVALGVEGLGPADNFRLVGDFTAQPVPEPGVLTLFGAAVVALSCRRFMGRS